MINNPLVSVIIPTYKRADYLIRAIESVLNQTYSSIEIIVVDDNDGDDEFRKETCLLLKEFIDKNKIIYLKHPLNMGLPTARNTGIKASKGDFIAFLDDDDAWHPEKTNKQLHIFETSDQRVGVVSCGWNVITVGSNEKKIVIPKYKGDLRPILGLNHVSPPSMVMIKRKLLFDVDLFDESFRWRQDIELFYRLSEFCTFDFVAEPLVDYYIHEGSMSRNFLKKEEALIAFLDKHYHTLKNNNLPLSEIYERLAEYKVVNGKVFNGISYFFKAWFLQPKRVKLVAKISIALTGAENFKRIRKFNG